MTATLTQPKLVSASELSRKIQTPVSRILRAVHEGFIQPDNTVLDGRLILFAESRAEEISQRLTTLDQQPEELATA